MSTLNATSALPLRLRLLVMGGTGCNDSHMAKRLLRRGCDITFDNPSTEHRDTVLGGNFELRDLADREALDAPFTPFKVDAVFHFASFIQVGEA